MRVYTKEIKGRRIWGVIEGEGPTAKAVIRVVNNENDSPRRGLYAQAEIPECILLHLFSPDNTRKLSNEELFVFNEFLMRAGSHASFIVAMLNGYLPEEVWLSKGLLLSETMDIDLKDRFYSTNGVPHAVYSVQVDWTMCAGVDAPCNDIGQLDVFLNAAPLPDYGDYSGDSFEIRRNTLQRLDGRSLRNKEVDYAEERI